MGLIGHGWGIQSRTGHPVIIVIIAIIAEEIVQAITAFVEKDVAEDVRAVACIFLVARNNEMIMLIPRYFFRFLHELTIISFPATIELAGWEPKLRKIHLLVSPIHVA